MIQNIKQIRHTMRENGARGACYEVSQMIYMTYGYPPIEGVYETRNGRPICLHRWNLMPDGTILDGTADQFGEGRDIEIISTESPYFERYRPIWTEAFNPDTIEQYAHKEWYKKSDKEFWEYNRHAHGWWLDDLSLFIEWKQSMAEQYPSFRRQDDIDFLNHYLSIRDCA